MQLSDEEQVKNALGIESWGNLSKEKFLSFVSELPNIDKDVAIAIVGQFPDFKALASDAVATLQDGWGSAVAQNQASQKQAQEGFERYVGILEHELERDQIAGEDRFRILEMIREAAERMALKDSENKAWLLRGLGVLAGAGVLAVAAALAVLGGKAEMGKGLV